MNVVYLRQSEMRWNAQPLYWGPKIREAAAALEASERELEERELEKLEKLEKLRGECKSGLVVSSDIIRVCMLIGCCLYCSAACSL